MKSIFFYLLILFLPTQLGRHFWPHFSNIAGIRVDYLAPTIYLADIFIFVLFVFWLIARIGIRNQESGIRNKKSIIHNSKFIILCAFLVFLIFGVILSKNQGAGWYGFIKLLEFVFLGFYTAYNFKKLRFDIVLLLFSIGIIFESFLAIFQYINQTSIGGIFYFLGERTFNSQTPGIANASVNGELILRPYATFSHPNVLAGYLVIAMTLILSGIKRIVFTLTLTIGTIALFLALSRIAIVVWVLILGFFIVRKFLIHNSYFLILLIAVFLFLGLAIPLSARFTELKLTDESITQRGELMRSSFEMIKSHPIFGVGLNNFLVELPNIHKQDGNVFYLQPAHNIYVLILSQTGIVGLMFFAWFLFKTFKNLKIKNSFQISNFKFQILLAVLVLGLFDHYFLTLQQGQLLFSFVLGLCWSRPSKRNVQHR